MSITKTFWNFPRLRSADNARQFDFSSDSSSMEDEYSADKKSKTYTGFGAIFKYLLTDRESMQMLNIGTVVSLFLAAILVPAVPGVSLVVADILVSTAVMFATYLFAAWVIDGCATSVFRSPQTHWFNLLNLIVGVTAEIALATAKVASLLVTVPLDVFNRIFGLDYTAAFWSQIQIGSMFKALNTKATVTSINITLLSGLFLSLVFSSMMPQMIAFGIMDATIAFGTYLLFGMIMSDLTPLPLHLVPATIGLALEGTQLAIGSVLSVLTLSADLVAGTVNLLTCCFRIKDQDDEMDDDPEEGSGWTGPDFNGGPAGYPPAFGASGRYAYAPPQPGLPAAASAPPLASGSLASPQGHSHGTKQKSGLLSHAAFMSASGQQPGEPESGGEFPHAPGGPVALGYYAKQQ